MFNLLRKLRINRRSPASRGRPPAREARPRMEELECRALPSAMGAFGPMTNNIQHDLRDITADAAALASRLPSAMTLKTDLATLTKDVRSGATTVTQDFITVVSDMSALGNSATGSVLRMERDLSQDVVDLARDLTPPGPARGAITSAAAHLDRFSGLVRDVQSDLKDVQSDGQALVTALKGNTSTAFAHVKSDLAAIAADVNPSKLASDLKTLTNDLTALSGQLTAPVARNVQHLIRDLGSDARDLRNDLTQVANQANRQVKDLQSDLTQLTNQLGSAGVTADLNALNAAMMTLAADVQAGSSNVSADITAVFTDERTLLSHLSSSQISAGARVNLFDIAFDLAGLAALNV